MISVRCIQAQRCHSNECPVGVATTDEDLMRALVVDDLVAGAVARVGQ